MKLYTLAMSNNARKAHAVVNHLGIPCEIIAVNPLKGDLRSAEFLAINPNGTVPALVDGDLNLWESNAIIIYLASVKVPESSLYAPAHQPEILRWLFWEACQYNKSLGVIAYQTVIKPMFGLGDPDSQAIGEAKSQFARSAPILEAHLRGRNHMVGSDWTLADYAVGSLQHAVARLPIDWSEYPRIAAFYQRLAANPHWSSTAPAAT